MRRPLGASGKKEGVEFSTPFPLCKNGVHAAERTVVNARVGWQTYHTAATGAKRGSDVRLASRSPLVALSGHSKERASPKARPQVRENQRRKTWKASPSPRRVTGTSKSGARGVPEDSPSNLIIDKLSGAVKEWWCGLYLFFLCPFHLAWAALRALSPNGGGLAFPARTNRKSPARGGARHYCSASPFPGLVASTSFTAGVRWSPEGANDPPVFRFRECFERG